VQQNIKVAVHTNADIFVVTNHLLSR